MGVSQNMSNDSLYNSAADILLPTEVINKLCSR